MLKFPFGDTVFNALLSLIAAVIIGFLTTVALSIAAYPFALGDATILLYALGFVAAIWTFVICFRKLQHP